MTKKINTGWYVLYTKPRHEKKVSARLSEQNIYSLLPTRKTLRSWHDRKKYVDEPLFPSYLFVYLDCIQNYYAGMDVEGVLYYVKTGKEVARVNESVIEKIRLIADNGKDIETTSNYFEPGQQLVIREGSLTGLSCELVQYNNKQKLLVRVEILKRNVLVTLPSEYLMTI
jgi:transcriptional antiterminator RfaH